MSLVQRGSTLLKRFVHSLWRDFHGYGTLAAKMNEDLDDNIVWIDMEMTGLDIETCHILEVACLVTDTKLRVISEDFHIVLNQSDDILENMDEWCIKQHARTGLTEACKNSKIGLEKAESDLLAFVKKHVPERKCPIAGNSVYMDRMFLAKYMPSVHNYLHYRIIDTSSIKEVLRRWNPQVYKDAPKKNYTHRAMDDIRESIEELQYYKENGFKSKDC